MKKKDQLTPILSGRHKRAKLVHSSGPAPLIVLLVLLVVALLLIRMYRRSIFPVTTPRPLPASTAR